MKTLKQLLMENPSWADLPVGIYCPDGHVDFVGDAGTAYVSKHNDNPDVDPDEARDSYQIVVFAAN